MGTHSAQCKYCEARIVFGTLGSPRKWVTGIAGRYFDKCRNSPGKALGEHIPDRNTVVEQWVTDAFYAEDQFARRR